MKDLKYFVRHCSFWNEDVPHTHTSFSAKKIKKLSINKEQRQEFYNAYADYVKNSSEEELCSSKGLNSITEKSLSLVKFFVDIDLKLEHFTEGLISEESIPEIIKDTRDCFILVLKDAFGKVFQCTSAFRMIYKCHLYFPEVVTTPAQAKSICEDVNLRLIQKYPWIGNKDRGIIDTSVYKSGLRMLYSHKGSMVKSNDKESHEKIFKNIPYGYYYRLGDIDEKGNLVLEDVGISSDLLTFLSIQCDENAKEIQFLESYRIISPTKSKGKAVAIHKSDQSFSSSSSSPYLSSSSSPSTLSLPLKLPKLPHHIMNTLDMDKYNKIDMVKLMKKMTAEPGSTEFSGFLSPEELAAFTYFKKNDQQEEQSEQLSDQEITPEMSFAIRDYLDKAVGGLGMDSTILDMKINQYGSILVTLAPQTCPFVNRKHKRTEEKNVSATYAVLNAFECTLRCFDDDCTDVITLKYPTEDLSKELKKNTKHYILKRSLYKQTNETVAEFIFTLLRDSHAACAANGSSYIYYHYVESEHRWVQQEHLLLTIMSENGIVQQRYNDFINETMADPAISDPDKKKLKGLWLDLENQLQTTAFVRGGVLPILARKLEDYWMKIIKNMRKGKTTTFQSMLDDNPKLMGFKNGVWDFGTEVFRDGCPTDFISMSTNLDYNPLENFAPGKLSDMLEFLSKIYTKKEHRDYVIGQIASCLNGTPDQQRFFLMTGRGANGKSTLVRLLNLSFGDYAGEVNITLFTKPRPPANAPTPELIAIKGQRFVSCSEPNARDPFNLGTIKWLTGGDRITAAQKFEKNQSFYLQCTFFSLTNDIPPINATISDNGTWRRMKPVEHYSRFLDEPDENNPLEFLTDNKINEKMEEWREVFISYLIHIFLLKKPYPVPQEFKDSLHKLQGNNDIYSRFVTEMIVKDKDSEFKEALGVFTLFNEWNKTMKISRKEIPYDHFEKHMLLLIGQFDEDAEERTGWNVTLKPLPSHFF